MKHVPLGIAALLFVAPAPALAQATASANMIDGQEQEAGTVTFTQTRSGMLRITVELIGLPAGPHGIHIHEKGQCDLPDFKSAGGHVAGGKEHGVEAGNGPHPGDLPNVTAAENGVVRVEFFTDRLTLDSGDNSLLDADGSAVVVHSGPDDYSSQPAGNSGDRIACGTITQPK